MTQFEEKLARDLSCLPISKIFSTYYCKVEKDTTVKGVIDVLKKEHLLQGTVRNEWKNDGNDKDGLYLIQDQGKYQVFMGSRGIKHWLEEHGTLEPAVTSWVDKLLNLLGHSAPDSRINNHRFS